MAKIKECEGWPHEYAPFDCPVDAKIHNWETNRRETTPGERSNERVRLHQEADAAQLGQQKQQPQGVK